MNCTQCGTAIDYRSATGLCLEHFRESGGKHKPMPADFAVYSVHKSSRELCPHYGVSRSTITIWRRECDLAAARRAPWTAEEDAYLRAHYGAMGFTEIGAHLGRSCEAAKARAQKIGIQSARKPGWNLSPRPIGTSIAAGHSGEVAYLQAYGPIYRCHNDGTPAPIGAYWYWAGNVLTHDEMEARARAHRERKALLAA